MTNAATVTNAAKYRFHMQVFVPLLALFAFFMILGQSISGARFGAHAHARTRARRC